MNTLSLLNINTQLLVNEFGFGVSEYDILTGFLEGSLITNITCIRHGEVYITLKNQVKWITLQLLGDSKHYTISASPTYPLRK